MFLFLFSFSLDLVLCHFFHRSTIISCHKPLRVLMLMLGRAPGDLRLCPRQRHPFLHLDVHRRILVVRPNCANQLGGHVVRVPFPSSAVESTVSTVLQQK